MSDATKTSFNLNNALLPGINRIMKSAPKQNQTQVLNQLIERGLNAEAELEKLRQREDYVLLKTLYMMRVLAGSRGDEFLKEVDEDFEKELPAMKEMLYEEGMDYVNG